MTTQELDRAWLEANSPEEDVSPQHRSSISPFDVPGVIGTETVGGDAVVEFHYPDDEPFGEETPLDESAEPAVRVRRGMHSGKIKSIRFRFAGKEPGLADRLASRVRLEGTRRRINQRFNQEMIAKIVSRYMTDWLS